MALIGLMPNAGHQGPDSVVETAKYTLAIVEFDDQGRCYDRDQMQRLSGRLAAMEQRDAVIVVFVHGWKHDGRSTDDNLAAFRNILDRIGEEEGVGGVPVLGIFVAWRGLSLYGCGLENLSFWDRKQAGMRVAMGAPRELFGRLRHFRRVRLDAGGTPLLVIIGHSFGGMIVYTALAQSLIEAAIGQDDLRTAADADLVLLVNPAFEAVRYLPIHDLENTGERPAVAADERPLFVSVTAANDWATGIAFPLGMAINRLQEATRGTEEKQALTRTMGHLPWMQTHRLTGAGRQSYRLDTVGSSGQSLFWVVQAAREVIDGHNGIWQPIFIRFVEDLVLGHVRAAMALRMRGREG